MYFSIAIISFAILSLIVGYGILRLYTGLARYYGILDRPHLYTTERGREPAPYGIGIAIVMTLIVLSPLVPIIFDISPLLEKKLAIVLILASILAIVSSLDDLDTIGKSRISVPPLVRLIMQIGVGLVIGITSIKISYISDMLGGVIRLDDYFFQIEVLANIYTIYYIPLIMTTLWYVLVFNSINFSDGIPGLT